MIFTRYDEDEKPVVRYIKDGEDKKIAVSVRDHVLDMDIEIAPDRIILPSAVEPQEDAFRLSRWSTGLSFFSNHIHWSEFMI